MTDTHTPRTASARIAETVSTWEGVTAAPHRFGGIEFRAGGRELGHLHGDILADLLLPRPARNQAVAEGKAQPHHVLPESNWVSVYIRRPEQVDDIIAMLRLAYERAIESPIGTRENAKKH
jgi:hypothetical protein